MNAETKIKYKRYDQAFKKSAMEHWLIRDKSARQIAAELVINVQNLPKWKQKFKALPAGQTAGTLEALQAESRQTYGRPETNIAILFDGGKRSLAAIGR